MTDPGGPAATEPTEVDTDDGGPGPYLSLDFGAEAEGFRFHR